MALTWECIVRDRPEATEILRKLKELGSVEEFLAVQRQYKRIILQTLFPDSTTEVGHIMAEFKKVHLEISCHIYAGSFPDIFLCVFQMEERSLMEQLERLRKEIEKKDKKIEENDKKIEENDKKIEELEEYVKDLEPRRRKRKLSANENTSVVRLI